MKRSPERKINTCVVLRVAPRWFVVEHHTITERGIYVDGRSEPTTLRGARQKIPPTMRCAGRREVDPPSIIEVWF